MALGPTIRDQLTAPGHAAASAQASAPHPAPPAALPRPGWPEKADLDYTKTLLELGLLLLGIPYVLHRLATKPKSTVRKAGESHLS